MEDPAGFRSRPKARPDAAADRPRPVPGRPGDARLVSRARPPRFLSEVTGIFGASGWLACGRERGSGCGAGGHGDSREGPGAPRRVPRGSPLRTKQRKATDKGQTGQVVTVAKVCQWSLDGEVWGQITSVCLLMPLLLILFCF